MLALLATTSLLVTLYITPAVIYPTFNAICAAPSKAVTSHIGLVSRDHAERWNYRIPVSPQACSAKRRVSAKIMIL